MSTTRTHESENGTQVPRLALLRPEQAAEMLGVTSGTLSVWRSTRRYPLRFIRVGRHVRYRLSDIEEFLRLRTEPGDRKRLRSAN